MRSFFYKISQDPKPVNDGNDDGTHVFFARFSNLLILKMTMESFILGYGLHRVCAKLAE